MAMLASILLLFFLPWLDKSPVRSGHYRPLFKRFFWLLLLDVAVLGYVGGAEINAFNIALGQFASAYYFIHFLIILPLVSIFERPLPLPNSISESVLHGEKQEAAPIGVTPPAAATAAE
jgi:ubiquinol-cytochrome c reductase cytochrome b subunit